MAVTILKSIKFNEQNEAQIAALVERSNLDFIDALRTITPIANDLRKNGDEALRKYTLKFDKANIQEIRVPKSEIDASEEKISKELSAAISIAIANIRSFHSKQARGNYSVDTMTGVTCKRKFTPIENVGLYVPSGNAPLFSSLMMSAIPAQIAGCSRIAVCVPPNEDGTIADEILFVAKRLGLDEIYKAGGAQAIFAMAYGTETIQPVNKIFGPGNQYVTAAKYMVTHTCAIDGLAGPSEAMIVADETSNPDFVAADLLSQAEHGADSQVVLLTTSETTIKETIKSIEKQLDSDVLTRKDTIKKVLAESFALLCETDEQIVEFINSYAPEHLIINLQDFKKFSDKVINAGSVFLGNWTPEAAGDYASGTNHILPTMGFAKSSAGVSVEQFGKYITFQTITQEGLDKLGPEIEILAKAEKLTAHANSVTIRLDELVDG